MITSGRWSVAPAKFPFTCTRTHTCTVSLPNVIGSAIRCVAQGAGASHPRKGVGRSDLPLDAPTRAGDIIIIKRTPPTSVMVV